MERYVYQKTEEDYIQSANTLFHFMKEQEYLTEIMRNRAIIPRYCCEDFSYLGIRNGEYFFREALVLEKCFCDIPLHKISEKAHMKIETELPDGKDENYLKGIPDSFSHTDFYGEYGIAFSKAWGEKKGLQPVQYLNSYASQTHRISQVLNQIITQEEENDLYADELIERLCYLKPLRGVMERHWRNEAGEDIHYSVFKNFHDEQEWRYVPDYDNKLIANPKAIEFQKYLTGWDLNDGIKTEYREITQLSFQYDEIRYLIVPSNLARVEFIDIIMSIPDDLFSDHSAAESQKLILISKILVLDDIRKDW